MKMLVLRDSDGSMIAAVEIEGADGVRVEPLADEGQTVETIDVNHEEVSDLTTFFRR